MEFLGGGSGGGGGGSGGGVRMRRTMSTSLPATPTTSLNISSSVKRSSWSFLGLATSTSKVFEQAGA
jgi:hypothetical protein